MSTKTLIKYYPPFLDRGRINNGFQRGGKLDVWLNKKNQENEQPVQVEVRVVVTSWNLDSEKDKKYKRGN